jgi:hypothetical protein
MRRLTVVCALALLLGCSSSSTSPESACAQPLVETDDRYPNDCTVVKTCGSDIYKVRCNAHSTPDCSCELNGQFLINVAYPDGVCADPGKAFAACHFP